MAQFTIPDNPQSPLKTASSETIYFGCARPFWIQSLQVLSPCALQTLVPAILVSWLLTSFILTKYWKIVSNCCYSSSSSHIYVEGEREPLLQGRKEDRGANLAILFKLLSCISSDGRSPRNFPRHPVAQYLDTAAYGIVVFIISTICFGIMWIGGFYVSKYNNVQGLYFVLLYILSILPWIVHYQTLSKSTDSISSSSSSSYTASFISWQAKSFWIFAFLVFTAELYHNIVFALNRDSFDKWELTAFSDSVLITFGTRYFLVGCLILFTIIQAMLPLVAKSKNNAGNGAGRGGEEEEGAGSARRSINNRNSTNPYSDYKPPSSFTDFKKHFTRLLPFIWPSGAENRLLQLMISKINFRVEEMFNPLTQKSNPPFAPPP